MKKSYALSLFMTILLASSIKGFNTIIDLRRKLSALQRSVAAELVPINLILIDIYNKWQIIFSVLHDLPESKQNEINTQYELYRIVGETIQNVTHTINTTLEQITSENIHSHTEQIEGFITARKSLLNQLDDITTKAYNMAF